MQQSRSYIVIYTAVLTVVCGVLLALAAEGLKPRQAANVLLEQKKNILATIMDVSTMDKKQITETYDKLVKEQVVDAKGNAVKGKNVNDVVIAQEAKKPAQDRLLPVYEVYNKERASEIDYVILPVYGRGLWDDIWGFICLKNDYATINGVNFGHKAETPGLGARISTDEVQNRFKGKKVFEGSTLSSVYMMKGEGNDYSGKPHQVDGMSGATLTGKGVNEMLKSYLTSYESYLKSKDKKISIK